MFSKTLNIFKHSEEKWNSRGLKQGQGQERDRRVAEEGQKRDRRGTKDRKGTEQGPGSLSGPLGPLLGRFWDALGGLWVHLGGP